MDSQAMRYHFPGHDQTSIFQLSQRLWGSYMPSLPRDGQLILDPPLLRPSLCLERGTDSVILIVLLVSTTLSDKGVKLTSAQTLDDPCLPGDTPGNVLETNQRRGTRYHPRHWIVGTL